MSCQIETNLLLQETRAFINNKKKHMSHDTIFLFLRHIRLIQDKNNNQIDKKEIDKCQDLLNNIVCIYEVEMPKYHIDNYTDNSKKLAIDYLKKEIDSDLFKTRLLILEQQEEKNKEIYNIFDMYTIRARNFVHVFINAGINIKVFEKLKTGLQQLTIDIHDQLLSIINTPDLDNTTRLYKINKNQINNLFKCKETF